MILYHISSDLNFNGQFKPRIPLEIATNGENNNIPRICVAPTIEQCLASIGCCEGTYRVFKVDTNNFSEKHIIKPEVLSDKQPVPDALFHKEHWITEEFHIKEEDQFLIEVLEWEEDFLYLNKENNSYTHVESNNSECGIVISNLNYKVLTNSLT